MKLWQIHDEWYFDIGEVRRRISASNHNLHCYTLMGREQERIRASFLFRMKPTFVHCNTISKLSTPICLAHVPNVSQHANQGASEQATVAILHYMMLHGADLSLRGNKQYVDKHIAITDISPNVLEGFDIGVRATC